MPNNMPCEDNLGYEDCPPNPVLIFGNMYISGTLSILVISQAELPMETNL